MIVSAALDACNVCRPLLGRLPKLVSANSRRNLINGITLQVLAGSIDEVPSSEHVSDHGECGRRGKQISPSWI